MNLRVSGRSRVIDVLLIAALAGAGTLPAFAVETHQFDVHGEDAPTSIRDFASQAHVQILVAGENVREKHLHPVAGEFSTEEGLRLLLADSGLSPQYVGDRSIALVKASDTNTSSQFNAKEGKKSSSGGFRLAQLDQRAVPLSTNSPTDRAQSGDLAEIIVTAQKKEERLSDVPVPVTVLNANSLADKGQVLLRDYFSSVPGLNLTPDEEGSQMLTIRGVTTGGFELPTVSVLIDDVPFGAQSSHSIPDFDPGDLARIEVLRGPQGTLYGADAMGGLIKYVTIDPSVAGYSGRIEVGTSDVYNGAGPGFNVRGAANIPLSETLAVRVSGFRRQDPGYIDNVKTGQRGVNEAESNGARVAALWKPTQDFSIKLSALFQKTAGDGVSDVDKLPGLGDLQQSYITGTGAYVRNVQAYSAIVKGRLGSVDLIAITGYNVQKYEDSFDWTSGLLGFAPLAFPACADASGNPICGIPFFDKDFKNFKLTQEIRLSGSWGRHFDWLLGGFFTHDHSRYDQTVYAADYSAVPTGKIIGQLADVPAQSSYLEYAEFAAITYRITDRLDIQLGGRESENTTKTLASVQTGPLFGAPPDFASGTIFQPETSARNNAFTYLITPRFRFSPDSMIYARLASGYRPGGSNGAAAAFGAPATFNSDKTDNYEIGFKGEFLEHKLSIDASVYYVDWRNIQIGLLSTQQGFGYTANAGKAKSEGVEFSVTARPLAGLEASAWVSYDDAVLTQSFPANSSNYGKAGDRLPSTPRVSGNLSIQQEFPVTDQIKAFVGGQASYIGDRLNIFVETPQRETFAGYAKIDLHAGIRVGTWTTNIYVNNLANRLGIIGGGVENANPFAFYVITPRTVGASLVKTF
jgi:iron complex outermembrane receptor protein